MEITISGHTFPLSNQYNINLRYDSVASRFSCAVYFDPYDDVHKRIFKPYTYQRCTIHHDNVLLLTGTFLSPKFTDGAEQPVELVMVSGCSLGGVLEDCTPVHKPLQMNNLKIIDIVETMTAHYQQKWGFKVIVDPEVATILNTVIPVATPSSDEKVARYLDKLLTHYNVILSHDRYGNVVLTKVKSDRILTTETTLVRNTPVPRSADMAGAPEFTASQTTTRANDRAILFDFNERSQWLSMSLDCNGQTMHSDVEVVSEVDENSAGNAVQSTPLINPFVLQDVKPDNVFDPAPATPADNRGIRPLTVKQNSENDKVDNAAPETARSVVGDEIKDVLFGVEVQGFTLNGNVITPNQMITAINPRVYLYNKTKFFIQAVQFIQTDVIRETTRIQAVPPSAYGTDDIKTIF